jgi:hypothetical protein
VAASTSAPLVDADSRLLQATENTPAVISNVDPSSEPSVVVGVEPVERAVWHPVVPKGYPSKEICDRVTRLSQVAVSYIVMTNSNKAFRNPSIHESLVKIKRINQTGTHFPMDTYQWTPDDYVEKLAEAYREAERRHIRKNQQRTQIEFVSSSLPQPRPGSSVGAGALAVQSAATLKAQAAKQRAAALAQEFAIAQSASLAAAGGVGGTGSSFASIGDRKRKSKWD